MEEKAGKERVAIGSEGKKLEDEKEKKKKKLNKNVHVDMLKYLKEPQNYQKIFQKLPLRNLVKYKRRSSKRKTSRKEKLKETAHHRDSKESKTRSKRFLSQPFISNILESLGMKKKHPNFQSKSKLKHFSVAISKYDLFISRHGVYIFIPFMMVFTTMYILCLKWRFLDTDLLGVEASAYLFEKMGRTILQSNNQGLRKDPRTGKMFFLPGYEKDEEADIKDVFREIAIMAEI